MSTTEANTCHCVRCGRQHFLELHDDHSRNITLFYAVFLVLVHLQIVISPHHLLLLLLLLPLPDKAKKEEEKAGSGLVHLYGGFSPPFSFTLFFNVSGLFSDLGFWGLSYLDLGFF